VYGSSIHLGTAIIDVMTDSVIVRKLPPGLKQGLRERAAAHGRSVEAEVRQILMDVVFPDEDFVLRWVEGACSLPDGPELELPERQPGRAPVTFE
jgi:plasmid stability protein